MWMKIWAYPPIYVSSRKKTTRVTAVSQGFLFTVKVTERELLSVVYCKISCFTIVSAAILCVYRVAILL